MQPAKRLLVIDVSAFIFRAHYGLRRKVEYFLRSNPEQPTGALFGFAQSMIKALRELSPSHVVGVLEGGRSAYRLALDAGYKAGRAMPKGLGWQLDQLPRLSEALGIHTLQKKDTEADDIIGAVCRVASEEAFPTQVLTFDKDLCQLVDEHVHVLRPDTRGYAVLDREAVHREFGVLPEQIPDFLALAGDPVDNIPGCPKIGAKTAAKLLAKYPTVEKLLLAARTDPTFEFPRYRETLLLHEAIIHRSKELALIPPCEDELPPLDALQHYGINTEMLDALAREFGFPPMSARTATTKRRVVRNATFLSEEEGEKENIPSIAQPDAKNAPSSAAAAESAKSTV